MLSLEVDQVIYNANSSGIQEWKVVEKTDGGYLIARTKVDDWDHIPGLSTPYYPTKEAAWKLLRYTFS